jgi:hypothetical protein
MTIWDTEILAAIIGDGLAEASRAFDLEQAVRGIDALDELELHVLVQAACRAAGFGVHPEERYPSDRRARRRSVGRRCDLVLTAHGRPLADSLPPTAEGTPPPDGFAVREPTAPLAEVAASQAAPLAVPDGAIPLAEAFWLEIKTLSQFGPEGPTRAYSGRFLGDVAADLAKMGRGPGIEHAGLLVILFTRDLLTARHDLLAWEGRCREKDLPLGSPARTGFAINDRLGNGYAAVSLFPIRTGQPS